MIFIVIVWLLQVPLFVTSQTSLAKLDSAWILNSTTSPGPLLQTQGRTGKPITLGFTTPTCIYGISCKTKEPQFYLSVFLITDAVDLRSPDSQDGREYFNFYNSVVVAWRATAVPVHIGAYLSFRNSGSLELSDVDGSLVWSTETDDSGAEVMELESSGNLVLRNRSGGLIWQSFDHPSDALLPMQPLRQGMKLMATVSDENKETGYFWIEVSRVSVMLNSLDTIGELWSSGNQVEISFLVLANSSLEVHGKDGVLWSTPMLAPMADYQLLFKIYPNGEPRLIWKESDDRNTTTLSLKTLFLPLKSFTPSLTCGISFSASQGCVCPGLENTSKALEYVMQGGEERCKPDQEPGTICEHPSQYYMLETKDQFYYTQLNISKGLHNITAAECNTLCIKNCSCRAVLIQESTSTCFQMPEVLSLNKTHLPAARSALKYGIKWQLDGSLRRPETMVYRKAKPLIVVAFSVATFGIIILAVVIWKKQINSYLKHYEPNFPSGAGNVVRVFTYAELHAATKGFRKKIGSGGFGTVFEGVLADGSKIAVKRLENLSTQGYKQFKAEVKIIGSIHHKNLVRLKGFCSQELNRFLVYEYVQNGSLDKWIYKQESLDWDTRFKIVLEIARGITYLHGECATKVLHLDIKPQNILLNEDFGVKIADFGLSRMLDQRGDPSQIITMIRGTPGYMAPEWLQMRVSEKMDVYSFGIVVLEVVTGLQSFLTTESLCTSAAWVFNINHKGQLVQVLRERLRLETDMKRVQAEKLLRVGLQCIQPDPRRRPLMNEVVKMLMTLT